MIILLLVFILIFIPIPIKIEVLYKEFFISLKIFNKFIFKFDLKNILNYINVNHNNLNKKSKLSIKKKFFFKIKKISIKKLLFNLNSSKFKPIINTKIFIDFGISDSATCAIIYGLLWNIPLILKTSLSLVFNVKNISLSINPKFNSNYLLFNINSIFYISLANIIYIMFLLFKSFKNKEEIINE